MFYYPQTFTSTTINNIKVQNSKTATSTATASSSSCTKDDPSEDSGIQKKKRY